MTSLPPRVDLYYGIHKALRACMSSVLVDVGRLDCGDDSEVDRVIKAVLQLVHLCESHAMHENKFVHPALETASKGASQALEDDHAEQERALADLRGLADQVRHNDLPARWGHAQRLYTALAVFVADNFKHMQQEEESGNRVLWFHYDDARLANIHRSLVSSIPADETLMTARWMLPAMTPPERLEVLKGMKAGAPRPAFEAVLKVIAPHMEAKSYQRLLDELECA